MIGIFIITNLKYEKYFILRRQRHEDFQVQKLSWVSVSYSFDDLVRPNLSENFKCNNDATVQHSSVVERAFT